MAVGLVAGDEVGNVVEMLGLCDDNHRRHRQRLENGHHGINERLRSCWRSGLAVGVARVEVKTKGCVLGLICAGAGRFVAARTADSQFNISGEAREI